jgi:nucleoside-diphosphate-sugar epimerase
MRHAEVAVIGGSGFIGRPLCRILADSGYQVRAISRGGAGRAVDGIRHLRGDVADAAAMRTATAGAAAVVHMSTGGGNTWADFDRDFVQGARHVAEACLEQGVPRLVYVSSIAALYLGGRAPVTCSTPPDPEPASRSLYARAKIEAERVLREYRGRGLPLVIVRPGVVMGAGGILTHSGIGYWASDLCCLGWGMGNTPLPFVLVEDVAKALAVCVAMPGIEGEAFNLVGDVRIPAGQFVDLLGRRLRRRFRFYPQPLGKLQALEIAKWLVKCAARKADNPFPSYRDLKSRSLRAPIDCAHAKRVLGWTPNRDPERFLAEAVMPYGSEIWKGDLRLAAAEALAHA